VDNVMISKLTSNFLHFADTYVRSWTNLYKECVT
jgi:hypothetical protein